MRVRRKQRAVHSFVRLPPTWPTAPLPRCRRRPTRAGAQARKLVELASRVDNIVFVSDFIYSDSGLYDMLTEDYRAALAECDRALAAACDTVVEVFSTNPILYKGRLPF